MFMKKVTVLGLGSMGVTLAQLFIKKARKVTVWNRTRQKTLPLVDQGAAAAATAAEAVGDSPLVVMCVYDYAAVNDILAMPGFAQAMAGKTLVQLTTGSPADATESAQWAARHGVAYLEGAIQAAPSQMGEDNTPVLISGSEAAFKLHKQVLSDLAGNFVFLGSKMEAASTMDLATLSYVYGGFVGFMQGALIAEAEGLDISQFGKIVADISPSFGSFFAHEGKVIQSKDFTITESPLRISVEATQRIHAFAQARGLNTEFSALAAGLLKRAQQAGLENKELAALIQVLRK
ncbi:MAG: NAD(P)-dependent oxidoreductase [Polaromonas sp.]|nr:NAD(P)-dependent oxidoreductase [Polaromonas sp.]